MRCPLEHYGAPETAALVRPASVWSQCYPGFAPRASSFAPQDRQDGYFGVGGCNPASGSRCRKREVAIRFDALRATVAKCVNT